jgi:peptide/nickel transport system permease protein
VFVTEKIKKTSLAKRNWNKLKRNKLAMVGLGIILFLMITALFAPLLTQYEQNGVDLKSRLEPPSIKHLLGTDKVGRDVYARMLYGGRTSILVGLSGAAGGGLIGIIIGCICGYLGGTVDKLTLRISEIFMAFPQLILVLILVVFVGQGVGNLVLIFSITGWMGTYRLVRGRFMSLREENFVEACRAFGIGNMSIMFKHILPNTLGPVIVNITLSTAGYILQESGLSFLGLGVPSGVSSWGNIINAAKSVDVIMNYWWLWVPPGLAISLFVLGFNFFGDGLRDVLDPTQ